MDFNKDIDTEYWKIGSILANNLKKKKFFLNLKSSISVLKVLVHSCCKIHEFMVPDKNEMTRCGHINKNGFIFTFVSYCFREFEPFLSFLVKNLNPFFFNINLPWSTKYLDSFRKKKLLEGLEQYALSIGQVNM